METSTKEIYYDEYCPSCKHKALTEAENPCHDCLTNSYGINTHKPSEYEASHK